MKFLSGLVAGALLTLAVPVCAQSLGDLAKKEAERRKAAPPAAKTYTNEDLKNLTPVAPISQGEPTKVEDTEKPAADKSDPAKGADAKGELYWRGRITSAREELRRNEVFRGALQTRIDMLASDAGNFDTFKRLQLTDDRQKAVAEQTRVATEIEKTTKLIADIEEEARKAGVPPGWLR